MQHIQNRQWLPENLKKVTLPTPANHCFQIDASYVERHTFIETKMTLWPKILLMSAEATKKAASIKMRFVAVISKIIISIASFMSFIVTTLVINHLLNATVVNFVKFLHL